MAAFPEDIASLYFSSALSFLITLDFTSIESPIFALNEEKSSLLFYKDIFVVLVDLLKYF